MKARFLDRLLNVDIDDHKRDFYKDEEDDKIMIKKQLTLNLNDRRSYLIDPDDESPSQLLQNFKIRKNYSHQRHNSTLDQERLGNSITFTKEQRFRSEKPLLQQDRPLFINRKIGFQKTGVKFGLTKRFQFYLNTIKKAKEIPSPFDYFKQGSNIKVKKCLKCKSQLNRVTQHETQTQRNCCTFGNSFAKYQKLGSFDFKLFQNEGNPGIGQYNPNFQSIKKSPVNCIIVPRRINLLEFSATQDVSPMTYAPKYSSVFGLRNQRPHMGLGHKLDLGKPQNLNPGPGAYLSDGQNSFLTSNRSRNSNRSRAKSIQQTLQQTLPQNEAHCINKTCSVTRRDIVSSQNTRKRLQKYNLSINVNKK